MSDKIEREIEEILNRLDESGPGEEKPDRTPGLSHDSRLARISRRQIMLASLVLVVLVAAGLFFGLAYPSLDRATSTGSAGGETLHKSAGDQIGEGAHVGEARPEGSVDEGTDTDGQESEHGVDRPSEHHEEHDRDSGEQH